MADDDGLLLPWRESLPQRVPGVWLGVHLSMVPEPRRPGSVEYHDVPQPRWAPVSVDLLERVREGLRRLSGSEP